MKNIFSGIFVFIIVGLIMHLNVYAGVVPGSILKVSETSSALQCKSTFSSNYKTGHSCTDSSTCDLYNSKESSACGCESYKQVEDTSVCESFSPATCAEYETTKQKKCTLTGGSTCVKSSFYTDVGENCGDIYGMIRYPCSGFTSEIVDRVSTTCKTYNDDAKCLKYGTKNSSTCEQYNECRTSSHGCESYKTSPSFTTTRYVNENENESRPNLSSLVSIPNGYTFYNNEGDNNCYVAVDGTQHTAPSSSSNTQCDIGNSRYYKNAGSDGVCNISSYQNYQIKSYDQLGNISIYPVTTNSGKNTCIVEGRIVKTDNVGPEITINSINFSNNTNKWCNLNKYKGLDGFSTYGDEKSPTTEGCEFYKNLSSFSGNNPDLVSDLTINITDESALSSINVTLGTCSADISLSKNLSELENNGNGVKSAMTALTLYGHKTTKYGNQNIGSLKTLFGKDRLDDCLGNGQNYIVVTAKDNSRSASNINTLQANTKIVSTKSTKFINIDNIGVSFGTDTSDVTSDTKWYDRSVSGKFVFEDLTNSGDKICKAYEKGTQKVCTGKPNNSYWVSPSDINPNTGEYFTFTCDGEPLSVNGCDWSCDAGYEKKNGVCEPVVTTTTCWTLGVSRLGHDTKLCDYTPIYSWQSKADTICNGSYYLQSSVCKDQHGNIASNDLCSDPEPETIVPCSVESQGFTIGRDAIGNQTNTIGK